MVLIGVAGGGTTVAWGTGVGSEGFALTIPGTASGGLTAFGTGAALCFVVGFARASRACLASGDSCSACEVTFCVSAGAAQASTPRHVRTKAVATADFIQATQFTIEALDRAQSVPG